MRAVNLLPRDLESSRSGDGRRLPILVAAGGVAVVTAASAFLVLSASGAADEQRAQLALTESAVASLRTTDDPGVPSGLVTQERADRVAALSAALSSRIAVDSLLRQLSYVLPADAWLTGLTANAPTEPDPAAPPSATPTPASSSVAGVTIQGATFSHESVARVLARLSVIPALEDVRLTASARIQPQTGQGGGQGQTAAKGGKGTQKKQRTVVTFTITADLQAGGRS